MIFGSIKRKSKPLEKKDNKWLRLELEDPDSDEDLPPYEAEETHVEDPTLDPRVKLPDPDFYKNYYLVTPNLESEEPAPHPQNLKKRRLRS